MPTRERPSIFASRVLRVLTVLVVVNALAWTYQEVADRPWHPALTWGGVGLIIGLAVVLTRRAQVDPMAAPAVRSYWRASRIGVYLAAKGVPAGIDSFARRGIWWIGGSAIIGGLGSAVSFFVPMDTAAPLLALVLPCAAYATAVGARVQVVDTAAGARPRPAPVDQIKLDRSFVPGSGSEAIATAVVQMAGAFAVEAVAEGVESAEQADRLHALGYRRAQGYHFARPMPLADLDGRIRAAGAVR